MKRIILFLSVIALGPAPGALGQAPTADAEVFFEKKVRPLLVERCFPCHSAQAKRLRGGLRLDSREALLKGGDSGPAVTPGQAEESLLVKAVSYKDPHLQMPPNGQLAKHEIAILQQWVRSGVPFPGGAGKAAGLGGAINIDQGRGFWSFQPIQPRTPPKINNQAWPQRPMDAFILAELEKRNLTPSPRAKRRALIRRAYFDLIGLPPSPGEVEAFIGDESEDAYPRLLDRLLASPHHGERWVRLWLDLARYCDIAEPWAENKGQASLYRDWVVQALNRDLPYDQFVIQQLAADLVPGGKIEDQAALGFLGLSPSYWKELKLDPEVIKMVVAEEWEERIHTVTSTFLGLTVACARCHDHKFDPITTQDYYALAGVFASTKLVDRTLLPPVLATQVQKARQQVKDLQAQVTMLQAKKPPAPETVPEIAKLQEEIAKIQSATPHFDAPLVPAVEEASLFVLPDGPHRTKLEYKAGMALDVPMQIRGNPSKAGPIVPRRFLEVLSPGAPQAFKHGSGRLDLARAIVTDAAPLTARVIVNRVWRHHFGAGLVETPSDFGAQGERPSHPQLLDDLAARFLANGWSLRWLHREIMLSATYQQASAVANFKQANPQAIDPDNRLYWRMNRRRLEVEAWRDAMLVVSGTLDKKLGGPAGDLGDVKNQRRTLYGTVKRRELNDMLRLHDFPDPTTHNASRLPTTTPLQQLFTLNSPFLQQQAAALVRRLKTDAPTANEQRIGRAYLLLFGRPAQDEEIRLGLGFLTPEAPDTAWEQYAQVLLGCNEFLFVD